MRRATVAALVAGALIAAGCSGGDRVVRERSVSAERAGIERGLIEDRGTEPRATEHYDGPFSKLAVADYSDSLSGEPGGMATDREGAVVEVDDNTVVSFDRTATEQWSASVPGAALGWPLLSDQFVVVPTLTAGDLGESSGPSHSGADDSGGCVALDRATGKRKWSYEEKGRSGVSVAGAGSRVFCVFMDGVIVAVDRDTGTLVWRVKVDTRVPPASFEVAERSAIAVDPASGTLSFTAQWSGRSMLIVRDLATGATRGQFQFDAGPMSSPVVVAPGVIAAGSRSSVCRFDVRLRRDALCKTVNVPDGFDPASVPVVADGTLVLAGRGGEIFVIDIKPWKLIWSKRLPSAVLDARPVISDGVLLLADFSRVPWAFRISDGSKVDVPIPEGFVISTATDPAGGFAVAIRADIDQRVERWVPKR